MLPLQGIKIVDMSLVLLGPGAAAYLADQGAEVIKVEPLEGDGMRYRAVGAPLLQEKGLSKWFLAVNRNKRAIAVDVRTARGQEVVHRLAKWADVFVVNFRVGLASRVRMDYETLKKINPRLVYASISAFGETGPDATLPGYDYVIQARSGILGARRNSDGVPLGAPIMVGDMAGGMALAYGIMVALWDRERTGQGQRIDTSLMGIALAMQLERLVWVERDHSPLPGRTLNALYAGYRCGDGQWLAIGISEEHQWHGLCKSLDMMHLVDDPGFDSFSKRAERAAELAEILRGVFKTQASSHWLRQLRETGVPCALVAEQEDLPGDPQVVANGMFWEQEHSVVGKVKMVAPPVQFSGSSQEARLRRPTPMLGQHTGEVLAEMGYDKDAINALFQEHIVK